MLKVLQFSLAYAPSWSNGGPPRVLYDYARELTKHGCRVRVYTSDISRAGREAMGSAWPSDIAVDYFRSYRGALASFNSGYSMRELRDWFDRELPGTDVVHVGQTRSIANVVLHRACRRLGVPYVLSAFGSLPRRTEGIKTVYDAMFVRPFIRDAAALLAQTPHEMQVYRKFGGRDDQLALVPLAFDRRTFDALPSRGLFREQLGIGASAPVVLFLGRLHRTKGVDRLVRAFALAARREPAAVLVIVGHDCGAEQAIRDEVVRLGLGGSVHFVLAQFGPERLRIYVDADVYAISPAIDEETPMAAIEALACGTPVVTTARAEVPGLEGSGVGHVVPADDDERFANAVLDMVQRTREQPAGIRRAATMFARDRFEIECVGETLHRVLAGAAGRPAP